MKSITHKPLFWIILTTASLACIGFSYRHFSTAFPIVNLSLDMNRSEALTKAADLAAQLHIGPVEYAQAASFDVDQEVQTFVELEAGGKQAFIDMIHGSYYAPYQWSVRHFKECDTHELLVKFKPNGTPYGFIETLSENTSGPALELTQAQTIAEQTVAAFPWNINLNEYQLIEPSKEVRSSGRIDYQFTYERKNESVGKGTYRLRLVVSGDRTTEITHFIHIPEEFTLRYQEMRSANNSIAAGANMAYLLLYIFGGCILGLFFLMRRNWIVWKQPLVWALIVAALHALVNINQLPLSWMQYHTALSIQGFIVKYCMAIILQFLQMSIFYSLVFMVAESLTRAAFSYHPQLWHVWNVPVASSQEIVGRTVGGYLLVPFCLAFIIIFYILTSHYLDWWIPSASLVDPDILATYFPWLSCLVLSLGAGFMEECLFRAIPLSCVVLMGRRFGNARMWLVLGFIIQALIFGAAHANYAAQPAYARVVELLFFSTIQGLVFLWFGLLPAIITHFTYDVVLMALPLFVSTAHGAGFNQSMVIILALIPLLMVLRARIKSGSWTDLNPQWLNESWKPAIKNKREEHEPEIQHIKTFSRRTKNILIGLGFAGLILLATHIPLKQDGMSLHITRTDAVHNAQQILLDKHISPTAWCALPTIAADEKETEEQQLQTQFIWQEGGPTLYHEILGTYLNPARWYIRFTKWNGSITERAEEHIISLISDGKLYRSYHKLPEITPGKMLDESQARIIAHQGLRSIFNLNPADLNEISAVATKHPERKDWIFTYAHPHIQVPKDSQLRNAVLIAGDQIVGGYSYVHVPETWEREQLNRKNRIKMISFVCMLLLFCMLSLGLIYAVMHTKKIQLQAHSILFFCIGIGTLSIIKLINSWPAIIAQFNTSEPFTHQLFSYIGMACIGILFKAGALGIILAILTAWKKPYVLSGHHAWFWGICMGIWSSGIIALLQTAQRHYQPLWADYSPMAHCIPILSCIIEAIISFLILSALLMTVSIIIDALKVYWDNRPWLLGIICMLFGLAMAGKMNPDTLSLWLIIASALALVLLTLYLSIGRSSNQALIWASAAIVSSYCIQQSLFHAYPGVVMANIAALFSIVALAYYWDNHITR